MSVNTNIANELLTKQSGNIKGNVTSINKSAIIVKHEKNNIKVQSANLLHNVLAIIKDTDNKALNELNPTYNGINHAYVKVQSELSTIDNIEKSTDKIIKVINKVLLTSPNVPFSQFVETLKDLELYSKHDDLLRTNDYKSHGAFMSRINDVIMIKTFIKTYNSDNKSTISRDFLKCLSAVPCEVKINDSVTVNNFIQLIKEYKVIDNVEITDTLISAYKVAQSEVSKLD